MGILAKSKFSDTIEQTMAIELKKKAHEEAVASLQQYVSENMDEPIGNIAAIGLLDFFIEEIGPSIYNKAVSDVQERLARQISDLDMEIHQQVFPYWPRQGQRRAR